MLNWSRHQLYRRSWTSHTKKKKKLKIFLMCLITPIILVWSSEHFGFEGSFLIREGVRRPGLPTHKVVTYLFKEVIIVIIFTCCGIELMLITNYT